MPTYVVIRTGVYDQGVVEVSSDLDVAKRSAEKAASQESDLYHDFEIRMQDGDDGEFDNPLWCLTSDGGRRDIHRSWKEIR